MDRNYSEAKVLLVDDNNINLYAANKMLEEFGIVSDCVPNGKACLKKAGKKDYDIIFLDHMMPEMDGIETYTKLKEIDNFNTPVVVMTGNVGENYEALYRENGFSDYLAKPIDRTKMAAILEKYLGTELSNTEAKVEENSASVGADDPKYLRLLEYGFKDIDKLILDGMPLEEFETLLSIFQEESNDKLPDADRYAAEENLREYAVIVHGLKNDAAMINEMELREHALQHEIESKAGNLNFVKAGWNSLKSDWESVLKRIDNYFS